MVGFEHAESAGVHEIDQGQFREEIDVLDAEFLKRRIEAGLIAAGVGHLQVDAAARAQQAVELRDGAVEIGDVLQHAGENQEIVRLLGRGHGEDSGGEA